MSHSASPEGCVPPTRHWRAQHAADEIVVTGVFGTSRAVQTPLACRTSPTNDGAAREPSAPAATHEPEVVQATLCSGTLILSEGVPVTWGLMTAAVPQPASIRAATHATTAPRHDFRVLAVARLMAFPVFSRHVPL